MPELRTACSGLQLANEDTNMTYSFTVILTNKDDLSDQDADRLFEAGCDDATPGITN